MLYTISPAIIPMIEGLQRLFPEESHSCRVRMLCTHVSYIASANNNPKSPKVSRLVRVFWCLARRVMYGIIHTVCTILTDKIQLKISTERYPLAVFTVPSCEPSSYAKQGPQPHRYQSGIIPGYLSHKTLVFWGVDRFFRF